MTHLTFLSATDLANLIRRREVSSTEVMRSLPYAHRRD